MGMLYLHNDILSYWSIVGPG